MRLMNQPTPMALWQETVRAAEGHCAVELEHEIEAYLTTLLARYTDRPELIKHVLAINFLQGMQIKPALRHDILQQVGDECLLFSGLFPGIAKSRHVSIRYYVDLGQAAYQTISTHGNDLWELLAIKFVSLMDVLQSIRASADGQPDLLPLEAYEQWQEVGSQRAYNILCQYSKAIPFKK